MRHHIGKIKTVEEASSSSEAETIEIDASKKSLISSKFVSRIFLYVFLGLIISAISALSFSFTIVHFYGETTSYGSISVNADGSFVLAISCIASVAICYIDSLIMNIYTAKTQKAPLVGYIIYSVFIGTALSFFVLLVDFYTVSTALGLTALSFLISFIIGVSIKKINIIAYVAIALGIAIMFVSSFWFIIYLVSLEAFVAFDFAISIAFVILMMLVTAVDLFRIRKIADTGIINNTLALNCAIKIYCDLICLFVRIVRILVLFSKSKK